MPSVVTRLARRRGDFRSEAQLREHYSIERELADRLRKSTRDERKVLYGRVYEELLRRVPHHPRLRARDDGWHARRRREIERQIRFLERFLSLRTVFLEVGAGDCALARRVCDLAERVYAVDVACQAPMGAPRPANFSFVFTDGCNIPVAAESVHVVFSNQLLEHLHPDDALEQLRSIYAALAPGGLYVCVTPNRLYGPRDVSEYFDERPTGLHLHEYSAREVHALFTAQGFATVRFYCGARGWFVPCPHWVLAGVETMLDCLPARPRKRIADLAPMRALLGLRFAAIKPGRLPE